MTDITSPSPADRLVTRFWAIDLSGAGAVKSPKIRPANRRRQKIANFLGREGDWEQFSFRQTIPYRGYEAECPPSEAQYRAVSALFDEPCETRHQASTMLSARDYAEVVAGSYSFTAPRREFIWLCVTAFILESQDLRSRIRSWNIRNGPGNISSGISRHKPYKTVSAFAEKLVKDMQGSGSLLFG